MDESILTTIKNLLGALPSYDAFDDELVAFINSVLFNLCQIGIGPKTPFSINGEDETWTDFLGNDTTKFEAVKTYIYLKVRAVFDPAGTSYVLNALKEEANMYEWRLNVMAETPVWGEEQ